MFYNRSGAGENKDGSDTVADIPHRTNMSFSSCTYLRTAEEQGARGRSSIGVEQSWRIEWNSVGPRSSSGIR